MQDLIYEVESIIIDLVVGWVGHLMVGNQPGMQVITNVDSVTIPQDGRFGWETVNKDDSEESVKLMTCLHVACLLRTPIPLPIILQESTCETGRLVGWMDDIIECLEISPFLGTLHDGEQSAQVELFPC